MTDEQSTPVSFLLPITDVQVGTRRREDFGDLLPLAQSIARYGLLHPVVVDENNVLIAGERRLRCCKTMGWKEIPARRFDGLSDDEKFELELEENLRRKDLTPIEASKTLASLADVAAANDRASFVKPIDETPREGRPQESGSLRRVADRLGVSHETIRSAQQHVAAVESYPELAIHTKRDAVAIAKKLDAMPDDERTETREAIQRHDPGTVAALTDRPPIPNRSSPCI